MVPEDRYAKLVCPPLCRRPYAPAHEDQRLPAIGGGKPRSTLNGIEIHISPSIVDPYEIARTVEIAELPGRILRCDGVYRAQVNHPLAAQLDRFIG
ncbi:hypothetical protein [Leifsonia sp. P73]|uniref:hypothetical protein n=1 Tax=Leifsonia sp. P73 TaxID=3423959 RepID=UPI003DA35938